MFGSSVIFGLYLLITITAVLWAFISSPDTGSKNVDQIDDEICTMWFWRKSKRINEMVPGVVVNDDDNIGSNIRNTERTQQQYRRSVELT